MKKVMLTIGAFALVAMMAACTNPEAKAKEFANKACECMKMENQEDMQKCMEELQKEEEAYSKDLHGEDSIKYETAGQEAAAACMKEILEKIAE